MSDIQKPDLTDVWASGGAIIAPSSSKIQEGWTAEIPPHQWENFVQNRQDEALAYLMQKGVPEWDATTEYQAGKSFVQYGGAIYKALTLNTNSQPDNNPTDWVLAALELDDLPSASESDEGIIQIATQQEATALQNALKAITPATLAAVISNVGLTPSMTFAQITALQVDQGPIICSDMGGYVYTWQTSAYFTGYRSSVTGTMPPTLATTPRAWELEVVGGTWSTSDEKEKRVIAFFQEQGLTIDSGSWIPGQGMISDLGGGDWKAPDLRDMFFRMAGTDADTANPIAVGVYQADALQNITGKIRDFPPASGSTGIGAFAIENSGLSGSPSGTSVTWKNYSFDASRVVRTSVETRSANTAVAPVIMI